jgi:hypothetical protein
MQSSLQDSCTDSLATFAHEAHELECLQEQVHCNCQFAKVFSWMVVHPEEDGKITTVMHRQACPTHNHPQCTMQKHSYVDICQPMATWNACLKLTHQLPQRMMCNLLQCENRRKNSRCVMPCLTNQTCIHVLKNKSVQGEYVQWCRWSPPTRSMHREVKTSCIQILLKEYP